MPSSSAEQELGQIRVKKKPNGTGRKKIEMKKIEKNSSRKVAFSKRRKGLFKKGIELCRLCDAMIAIIVLSPKGRVYSNGYPSVEGVVNKFQSEEDEERQLEEVEEGGEEEEEEEEEEEYWWEEDIEGLELEELERRRARMEELRCNMALSLEEMMGRRLRERDLLGSERVFPSR